MAGIVRKLAPLCKGVPSFACYHAPVRWSAALQAIGAAALFGVSVPLAKRLGLDEVPLVGTALLYGGAGLALGATLLLDRLRPRRPREPALRREDLPLLASVIGLGGLLGPVLQLGGLARTTASAASLLLNLEVVFTVLVAVVAFREHLGRGQAGAAALVVAGASWLSWASATATSGGSSALGAAMVAGACLAWAIDNNLTQRLSARDPRAVTCAKGLGAGSCAALLATATGAHWPAAKTVALGLALGAVGYGSSLVLYVRALRGQGAARTGTLFATAPFVGALVSFGLLGERPHLHHLGAGALMALGVMLLLREQHSHEHLHEAIEHDHLHRHDEHHQHAHDGSEGPEPHSHRHRHQPLRHVHAHVPDLHHRHEHPKQ
jgi:drug/metabolite transporter (DMT)-like permease